MRSSIFIKNLKHYYIKVAFLQNETNVKKELVGSLFAPVICQSVSVREFIQVLNEIFESKVATSNDPPNLLAVPSTSSLTDSLLEVKFNKSIVNFRNIKLSDGRGLNSVAYLETQKKLLVSDYAKSALFILSITKNIGFFDIFDTFEHELLKKPGKLCIGKDDQIFVSEHSNRDRILVFDSNLIYLRQIKLKQMNISKMKIDLTDNQNLLYITDRCANKVVVRYSENHKFKTTFDILRPDFIEFDVNYIYITSYPDFSINKTTDEVHGLQKKSNCIFMLNKNDFKNVRTFSFDDWFAPVGLFINKNSNILTVADELDRHSMRISSNQFLHEISPNGTLVEKFCIKLSEYHDLWINDCCIIDKYLFICNENHLNGFELV